MVESKRKTICTVLGCFCGSCFSQSGLSDKHSSKFSRLRTRNHHVFVIFVVSVCVSGTWAGLRWGWPVSRDSVSYDIGQWWVLVVWLLTAAVSLHVQEELQGWPSAVQSGEDEGWTGDSQVNTAGPKIPELPLSHADHEHFTSSGYLIKHNITCWDLRLNCLLFSFSLASNLQLTFTGFFHKAGKFVLLSCRPLAFTFQSQCD